MKVKATQDYRAWNIASGQWLAAGEVYELDESDVLAINADAPGTLELVVVKPKRKRAVKASSNRMQTTPDGDR